MSGNRLDEAADTLFHAIIDCVKRSHGIQQWEHHQLLCIVASRLMHVCEEAEDKEREE